MSYFKGMRVKLYEQYTTEEGIEDAANKSCLGLSGLAHAFGRDYKGTTEVLETTTSDNDYHVIIKMGDSRCWVHRDCLEAIDPVEPEPAPEWAARWSKMMEV